MITDLKKFCVSQQASIKDTIAIIDSNQSGIALITSPDNQLLGTITDGDIRRFLLTQKSINEPCSTVMWRSPVTASPSKTPSQLKALLEEKELNCVPIVDEQNSLIGLIRYKDLIKNTDRLSTAVIMAGGEGKRLRPLTQNTPKPMIMLGDKPILEHIILSLKESEITNIYLSVNYLSDVIEDHFKDGSDFGVNITYLKEDRKLGTAGALSLLPQMPSKPFLAMNGDIVSKLSYSGLLEFHKHHRSVFTIAASEYNIQIPYGVLDLAGHYVLDIDEKPTKKYLCNAGVYALSPEILQYIPNNEEFNMTDLLESVVQQGLPVTAFPIHEYWVDIGQKKDLMKAIHDQSETEKKSETHP